MSINTEALVEHLEGLDHEVWICCENPTHEGHVVRCTRCQRGFMVTGGQIVCYGRIYPDVPSDDERGDGAVMTYRFEAVPGRGRIHDVRCEGES